MKALLILFAALLCVAPATAKPMSLAKSGSTVDVTQYDRDTIIVHADQRQLIYKDRDGDVIVYPVGVGREGFEATGEYKVGDKKEWPTWTPPIEMHQRQSKLPPGLSAEAYLAKSGLPKQMPPGLTNPLGARALYLYNLDGKPTLFRIHGTDKPHTIGTADSSGCIRMMNEDVMRLYEAVRVGQTQVVILPSR